MFTRNAKRFGIGSRRATAIRHVIRTRNERERRDGGLLSMYVGRRQSAPSAVYGYTDYRMRGAAYTVLSYKTADEREREKNGKENNRAGVARTEEISNGVRAENKRSEGDVYGGRAPTEYPKNRNSYR